MRARWNTGESSALGCVHTHKHDRFGTHPFSPTDENDVVCIFSPNHIGKNSTLVHFEVYLPAFSRIAILYNTLADRLGVVEFFIWDGDFISKDYLGEVSIPLDDWFKGQRTVRVRRSEQRGQFLLCLYFHVTEGDPLQLFGLNTEGVGTIRSSNGGPEYADDGLSSDEGESDSALEDDNFPSDLFHPATQPPPPSLVPPETGTLKADSSSSDVADASTVAATMKVPKHSSSLDSTMLKDNALPSSPSTPTLLITASPSGAVTPTTSSSGTSHRRSSGRKAWFRKSWGKPPAGFNFSAGPNDILGIVVLEIKGAKDLSKLRNMARTGWDMDPFVVISFGKKDEKLLFDVWRYETTFSVQLAVPGWGELSSDDHIGDVSLPLAIEHILKMDEETGLYPEGADGTQDGMTDFVLELNTEKGGLLEERHNPELTIRAKYQPYDALRQRFWRQYLKQYDADDSGTISRLELTSMLDSLGSTFSRQTIDSFFSRVNMSIESTLTMNEAIQCLESELCRPTSEKKRINSDESTVDTSVPFTPFAPAGAEQHSLQPQRRAVVEQPLPTKSPASGGFFRTLKTRAFHLLLRAAHPSPRPHTGITTVQTEDLDEATNLLGHAHPSATLDPSYVFSPRRLDGIAARQDQADEVFSLPVSPFSPHAKAIASSTCCPFPLPNPLTPTSPPRNIKPGRYATSPKTRINVGIQPSEHVQNGSLTAADAVLSRSLQMGPAQEPLQHRERRKAKRTSSVLLNVLCSSDALREAGVKKARDASERAVQEVALPMPLGLLVMQILDGE
ncbi:hypothetical protein BDY19DRAFT_1059219 [Irpex rosettiformis]|uniref:Uncharacterized protein n=1 Tax=Irpex rosettiformis TaxID=378272 RepID=A0ACB8TVU5_9APHY|nr:hypothetical protein BDY19DRAFT_1059219 [Irpex rosettiformis]